MLSQVMSFSNANKIAIMNGKKASWKGALSRTRKMSDYGAVFLKLLA